MPVDYDALAKQHGGVDYDALAAEAGGDVAGAAALKQVDKITPTPWYERKLGPLLSVTEAMRALPAVGGAVGGLVGGGGGTVFGMGFGGIPGAIEGAALGGAAGESARQLGFRALTGGGQADPGESVLNIGKEALIQGAAEAGGRVLGAGMKAGGRRLMQSAVKPTLKMAPHTPQIVKTLLDEGVNVSPAGLERLNLLLNAKNAEISEAVNASQGLISKADVAARLDPLERRLAQQVNPKADLTAVAKAREEFMEGPTHLLVPQAQAMKQGTYAQVSKSYGQLSAASIEAQKSLARGLKEEIAKEVPSIAGLNAKEAALINAEEAVGRRVALSGNRDPVGFAWVTHHPTTFLAALIDRAPVVKSMLARGMYSSAGTAAKVSPQLIRAAVVALSTEEEPSSAHAPEPAS